MEQCYKGANCRDAAQGPNIWLFQDEFEASSLIAVSKDDLTKPYANFVIRNSKLDNFRSGAYFGVSKHLTQDKLDKLNQAFLHIQQDGTLQKLYEKWLGHAGQRD